MGNTVMEKYLNKSNKSKFRNLNQKIIRIKTLEYSEKSKNSSNVLLSNTSQFIKRPLFE
jgi:hypothetical protein